MIFDSLTHVTPDGRWFHTDHDASEARLLREMDAADVGRAVVVALAGLIENDFVLEVCRRHPGRLLPGASFNPAEHPTPAAAATAFRAELHEAPFRVLKLHPRFNRYDPLDPRCLAVLDELASWASPLPVWLDSLFYFRGGSLRKPVVDTIHELVSRFERLQFVILHAGGSWTLQVAEAIRDCPNALLDVSFTLCRHAGSSVWTDLRYLLDTFDRRMTFGSDFPEISIPTALQQLRRLGEGLPPEKCRNVLGRNLEALLFPRAASQE
jgi:predicted TIM-barrel fold metal-dependent hydrolase